MNTLTAIGFQNSMNGFPKTCKRGGLGTPCLPLMAIYSSAWVPSDALAHWSVQTQRATFFG